jgi:hypothetical protein
VQAAGHQVGHSIRVLPADQDRVRISLVIRRDSAQSWPETRGWGAQRLRVLKQLLKCLALD